VPFQKHQCSHCTSRIDLGLYCCHLLFSSKVIKQSQIMKHLKYAFSSSCNAGQMYLLQNSILLELRKVYKYKSHYHRWQGDNLKVTSLISLGNSTWQKTQLSCKPDLKNSEQHDQVLMALLRVKTGIFCMCFLAVLERCNHYRSVKTFYWPFNNDDDGELCSFFLFYSTYISLFILV
jgi:hypothetical protein